MSRRFVTMPLCEPGASRSTAFCGRVVVLVAIASVMAMGLVAYFISTLISVAGQPVPVQEWFIGSWGFIDYGERPPAGST